MKIILYRDGKPGVLVSLPGEYPEEELAELLGGETEMRSVTSRLKLVVRADEEENRLPRRYKLDRLGQEPLALAGDAAVVAARPDGVLSDVTVRDLRVMEEKIEALKPRAGEAWR